MNGTLLDTVIIIDFLRSFRRSRPKNLKHKYYSEMAIDFMENLITSMEQRYISCHTLKELLQYPYLSDQEESRIFTHLPQFIKVLPTTRKVAQIAGFLSRQSAEYRNHHIEDCYIAATAIAYGLPLYTRNPNDFKYVPRPDLRIIVPYQYQEQDL